MLRRALLCLGWVALFATPAFAIEKGGVLLHVRYGGGQADWVQPSGTPGYLTSQSPLPEIRVGGELWYGLGNHSALTIGGGAGFFSETDKPGTAATPGAEEQKSTNTTFRVRVGHEMVGDVGDHFVVHGGGGVQYTSGKFKYESGSVSDETPAVTTLAIDGRIGMMMKVSPSFWVGGLMGNSFGLASAEQDGAKANWTTRGSYGEASLIFRFGGH